ncbi:hypothetical protein [Corynebacterium sp.]|uniref:hypothetical protein n=1 Tax=Corynebacterium sp. TaxID=1720 RepID=UPI0026DBA609|nr:hypothetical protein [Corynebacterium sp.]MDO5033195.1 hypothetical protein [Corynebacterium sp.]
MLKEGVGLSQKVLAVCAVFAACFMGYWASTQVQAESVRETGTFLNVAATANNDNAILRQLNATANAAGERIAVVVEQPEHTDVYAAGKFPSNWYNHIAPGKHTAVHALTDLDDSRQMLQLSGNEDFQRSVESVLDTQGAQYFELDNLEWSFLFNGTALAGIYGLVFTVCAVVVCAGAIARTRDYAIWELMGRSSLSIFGRELARTYAAPLFIAVLVALVALVFVACMVSPRVALVIARYSFIFLVPLLTVMVLSFLITAWAGRRLRLSERIKGKLPLKATAVSIAVVKLIPCVAAASLIAPALNHVSEIREQGPVRDFWSGANDLNLVELFGARDEKGIEDSTRHLADVARKASARGQFHYSQFSPSMSSELGGAGRDVISFNLTAALRSTEGALAQQLREHPPTRPRMYVPASSQLSPEKLPRDISCGKDCPITVLEEDGAEVATWQMSSDGWGEKLWSTEPIITVYPDDQLPEDRAIVAALTQKSAGFLGSVPQELREEPDLRNFVLKSIPASVAWAQGNRALHTDAYAFALGSVGAGVLALILAVIAGLLYRRLYAQRLRVYRFLGLPLWRAYRGMWVADLLICAITMAYLWNKGGQARALMSDSSVSPAVVARLEVSPEAMWCSGVLVIIVAVMSIVTMTLGAQRAGSRK